MILQNPVLNSGIQVESSLLSRDFIESLVVESKYDDDLVISLASNGPDNTVILPRYMRGIGIEDAIDERENGGDLIFKLNTSHRDGQKNLVSKFDLKVSEGKTGFLIVAPTGTGKTRIALECIQHLGRTALVVVPKSDLLKQWKSQILQHTDIPDHRIGLGEGGKINWINKTICITIADTLSKDREGEGFRSHFGTVIFDEVDRRIPAKTLNSVLGLMPAKYRLAVTATPSRRDGLDELIKYHVGECTIFTDTGHKMPAHIYAHEYKSDRILYEPDIQDKIIKRSILLKQITSDYKRNELIAKYASKLLKSGRRCAIVSDRIKQLKKIASYLKSEYGLGKSDVGYYVKSDCSSEERQRALNECRIILATYGLFGAGTDVPDLSSLIMASPLSSSIQIIGRVERFLEGKPQPIVIDIIDRGSKTAEGWFRSRLREYNMKNLQVKYTGGK